LRTEFVTFRTDVSQMFKTVNDQINHMPNHNNMGAMERRITDLDIAQKQMVSTMLEQNDNFINTIAHCEEIRSQQRSVNARIDMVESQHEGITVMLNRLRKSMKRVLPPPDPRIYKSRKPETYIEHRMRMKKQSEDPPRSRWDTIDKQNHEQSLSTQELEGSDK